MLNRAIGRLALAGSLGLLSSVPAVFAESRAIRVDGRWNDWGGLAPAYVDLEGDSGPSGVDFGRIWLTNCPDRFFFRFEAGAEISLQTYETLVLYLDTDHSTATGLQVNGIGADISWRFGERIGYAHTGGRSLPFTVYDAGIVAAPTVTSPQLELEIPRNAVVAGSRPVFLGPALRWLLRDENAGSGLGDQAPGSGQSASFTFDETPVPPYVPIALSKDRPEHLRVMTYNVYLSGLFERPEPFTRILRATRPEIINFQEIYSPYNYDDTRAQVEQMLPLPPGQRWYTAQRADAITASRYPIRFFGSVDANLVVLMDLPDDRYARDLFIINAHLPAGSNDVARQAEADTIMAFIRDAQLPGGQLELEPETPILIVGDLNLVGFARQLETLLTGDIVDEDTYGPDHAPDWDGTALVDVLPYHTGEGQAYTWWDPDNSFGPGRLDYVIYSDSVLSVRKSFVLRTESMAIADLVNAGLERGDTNAASDHLPVVADIFFSGPSSSVWRVY